MKDIFVRINQTRSVWQAIFIVCLMPLCLSSCSDTGEGDLNDVAYRTNIEKKIGLTFPKGSRWLGCHWEDAMEFSVMIGFQAPKVEVEGMFSPVKCNWRNDRRYMWDASWLSWFRPDSIKTFLSCETNYPDAYAFLSVLYDDSVSSESMTTVYLRWAESSVAVVPEVTTATISWRTDKPPIEKRIPLLVSFDECMWFEGQASNNTGRGLPAPEEYFVRGFIKITEPSARTLQVEYQWTPLTLDVATIDRPTTASIADGFFKGNSYLESKDFMREHTKRSAFSSGRIILNPDAMIVYFDLQNL